MWYQHDGGKLCGINEMHREYAIWSLGVALTDAAVVVNKTGPLAEEEVDALVEAFNRLLKANRLRLTTEAATG